MEIKFHLKKIEHLQNCVLFKDSNRLYQLINMHRGAVLQCLYYLTINTGNKFLNMIYIHTVGICISALVGVGIHQVVAGGWWLVVSVC